MIPLKYNTASQEIPLGHFVDEDDGKTAETGLTIANTDIKLWKSGATTLANKNSGGATHISGGIYYAVLDATDTGTYGPLKVFVHVSGARPVIVECIVMEADAYDALYAAAGTGHIEADAVLLSGDWNSDWDAEVQSEVTDALNAYDPPTHLEVVTEINDLQAEHSAMNGNISNILTDTAVIGALGAGLTAIPWNSAWDAEVQSEVTDALEAALSDSVPADGSLPSLKQAIYMMVQFLTERAVSGTTVTVKKVDGSTALMTFTLSDATSPVSITRAT